MGRPVFVDIKQQQAMTTFSRPHTGKPHQPRDAAQVGVRLLMDKEADPTPKSRLQWISQPDAAPPREYAKHLQVGRRAS
jgi:hypothetical protein